MQSFSRIGGSLVGGEDKRITCNQARLCDDLSCRDIPPSLRLPPNAGNCPLFEPAVQPDNVQQRYERAKAVLTTQLAVLQAARTALLTVSLPASATLQLLASLPPGVAL